MTDLSGARWRKSARSDDQGNCVEVADNLPEVVAVRDTKNRDKGTLVFDRETWVAFIGDLKNS